MISVDDAYDLSIGYLIALLHIIITAQILKTNQRTAKELMYNNTYVSERQRHLVWCAMLLRSLI